MVLTGAVVVVTGVFVTLGALVVVVYLFVCVVLVGLVAVV